MNGIAYLSENSYCYWRIDMIPISLICQIREVGTVYLLGLLLLLGELLCSSSFPRFCIYFIPPSYPSVNTIAFCNQLNLIFCKNTYRKEY